VDSAFNHRPFAPAHVVFGLTLKTFTLGHWFLLHDLNNAFATGESPTLNDLIQAVFVCGQDHRSARKSINGIGTPFFIRIWGWFNRRSNIAVEICKFKAYLAESKREPETIPSAQTTYEATTPQHWRILAMLTSEFNRTEAEALDTPLNRAFCLWAAEADRRGLAKSGDSDRQKALKKYAAEQDALKLQGVARG
jgi:hypothetical protein